MRTGVAALAAASLGAAIPAGATPPWDAGPEDEACPAAERVWSSVARIVPEAAGALVADRPNVEIADLGDRYTVRVPTVQGVLERTYRDPARDCEKRARFAAEFIVLALLPPRLPAIPLPPASAAPEVDAGGAGGGEGAVAIPDASAVRPSPDRGPGMPADASTPQAAIDAGAATPGDGSAPHAVDQRAVTAAHISPTPELRGLTPPRRASDRRSPVEIGVGWAGQWSPPLLGAPSTLLQGIDLRMRFGAGRLAGFGGAAFMPAQSFESDGAFRGRLLRVPAEVGLRVRWPLERFEVAADAALELAYEWYAGVTPHRPTSASRASPGLQVALTGSAKAAGGFAVLLRVCAEWLPFQQDLEALPDPAVAHTPSLWLGTVLGLSLAP